MRHFSEKYFWQITILLTVSKTSTHDDCRSALLDRDIVVLETNKFVGRENENDISDGVYILF